MIETALAGGTVAREIFCAGTLRAPHEDEPHRPRIHEGMGLGCSRARESSCRVAGSAFRAKRTAASEPANNGPRFTPLPPDAQNHTTNAKHEHTTSNPGAQARGLCPPDPLRFVAGVPIPERTTETGRVNASRLRSWPPARRSGRVSALPYPPAGSPPSLPSFRLRNPLAVRAPDNKPSRKISAKSQEKHLTQPTLSGRGHP